MCSTCGYDGIGHDEELERDYDYDYVDFDVEGNAQEPAPEEPEVIYGGHVTVAEEVLASNARLAAENRALFASRHIGVLNFTSAPGAGKTALLVAAIRRLLGRVTLAVIEGDQETERDAERIRATGCPAVQINTRTVCHLDAQMVRNAVAALGPQAASLLLIENVGNLACPAQFDLGEKAKVVVMSVAEGEDKPLKYPHMFRAAKVLVITKTDLLPHVDVDLARCLANARRVNPLLQAFIVSAKDGTGMPEFCDWLAAQVDTAYVPAEARD